MANRRPNVRRLLTPKLKGPALPAWSGLASSALIVYDGLARPASLLRMSAAWPPVRSPLCSCSDPHSGLEPETSPTPSSAHESPFCPSAARSRPSPKCAAPRVRSFLEETPLCSPTRFRDWRRADFSERQPAALSFSVRRTSRIAAGPKVMGSSSGKLTTVASPESGHMAARRPNVLIVLMDQLQRGALGAYGCRAARTPVLDRLAADGLRLTRAYVPLPQCAPARASMFTGRYPHQHRVYRVGDSTEFPADWQAEVGPLVHRTPLPNPCPRSDRPSTPPATAWATPAPGTWATTKPRITAGPTSGAPTATGRTAATSTSSTSNVTVWPTPFTASIAASAHPVRWPAVSSRPGASTIPVEHARTSWAVDQSSTSWIRATSVLGSSAVQSRTRTRPSSRRAISPDLVSPDDVDLPVSLADDLSTKPRTLRESVQHQWVRNMSDADWRRLIAHYPRAGGARGHRGRPDAGPPASRRFGR